MPTGALQAHAPVDGAAEELLRRAHERGLLSARGEIRALRLALTIADLRGAARVNGADVRVALAFRPQPLARAGSPA